MKKAALIIAVLLITVATMTRSQASIVLEDNVLTAEPAAFEPMQKPSLRLRRSTFRPSALRSW